jgi:hypothetical protein
MENGGNVRSASRGRSYPNEWMGHMDGSSGFRLARGQTASELASTVMAFAIHEASWGTEATEQRQSDTARSHDIDGESVK